MWKDTRRYNTLLHIMQCPHQEQIIVLFDCTEVDCYRPQEGWNFYSRDPESVELFSASGGRIIVRGRGKRGSDDPACRGQFAGRDLCRRGSGAGKF